MSIIAQKAGGLVARSKASTWASARRRRLVTGRPITARAVQVAYSGNETDESADKSLGEAETVPVARFFGDRARRVARLPTLQQHAHGSFECAVEGSPVLVGIVHGIKYSLVYSGRREAGLVKTSIRAWPQFGT